MRSRSIIYRKSNGCHLTVIMIRQNNFEIFCPLNFFATGIAYFSQIINNLTPIKKKILTTWLWQHLKKNSRPCTGKFGRTCWKCFSKEEFIACLISFPSQFWARKVFTSWPCICFFIYNSSFVSLSPCAVWLVRIVSLSFQFSSPLVLWYAGQVDVMIILVFDYFFVRRLKICSTLLELIKCFLQFLVFALLPYILFNLCDIWCCIGAFYIYVDAKVTNVRT